MWGAKHFILQNITSDAHYTKNEQAAKKGVADADKVIASGASAEADKIAAKIQLEVFSAILAATK